jgi:radical SAM family uncharacterized protein/radical SAM-linked protein
MQLLETLRNELLPQVQKPGQYLGLEWGAYCKDWDSAKSRIAIIYPDLYELGMSNFGIKILYNIVNKHPDYLCDRAYGVMPDMEELLEKRGLPLWGWETYKPLGDFDMLGFSLGYELCYTNIFTILKLSKIPFASKDRDSSHPLIFAGGPAAFNPEPMADFIDFFIIGDGEELIIEIQDTLLKNKNKSKEEKLLALAQLQGIYVPEFYQDLKPIKDVPFPVKKRVTQYLDDFNNPVSGPVPLIETVQDKQVLEIRRGCDRGCRFCQVGYTYLPVRERSPEDLYRLSSESIKNTGYEDQTLLSLSASDYTCLTEAARAINNEHAASGIGLSMPSQRADRFNVHLADEVSQARKSGMTFAPEAGTERMRKIINKGLSQEEIFRAIRGSYEKGWSTIKLYFMIGLPFEEDEDLEGILDILTWSVNMARELQKENPAIYKKSININCTISTFVPKSFTAFQWFSQCSVEEFHRKQKYLKDGLRTRNIHRAVKLNCTDPELALIESVLSRGDRSWGKVIKEVWDSGSRLDSWSENFNIERWQNAALKHGLDLYEEATRYREPGSKQVWDVLSIGFTDSFLLKEWQQAENAAETIPCTENKCHACGVCFNLNVTNLVAENLSAANPFVTEIDKEKRKQSCANFAEIASAGMTKLVTQSEIIKSGGKFQDLVQDQAAAGKGQPTVVVRDTESKQKLRLKISKLDDLKFISHLDFARLVERALRRTGLRIVHSTGFNQRMKITWLTAVPLFVESDGEYLELDLAERVESLENLRQIFNNELPIQARILGVEEIDPGEKLSNQSLVEAVYSAELIHLQSKNDAEDNFDKALKTETFILDQNLLDKFLNQEEILVKKFSKGKQKQKNLRPEIKEVILKNKSTLELRLNKAQRADEVLTALVTGAIWKVKKLSQVLA